MADPAPALSGERVDVSDLCPLCRKQYDEALARCPDDGTLLIEDRTGQSLGGRYTIRELLGLGARGVTVWAAWQEDADRMVAVKLLPLDDAGRDHFLDVSSQTAGLDHPNIVRLFDFNKTEDGLACGVMELVEGRPLSVELSDDRALPVEDALSIVQQILAGLAHAHEHGVLHLDLKPSNIFLVPAKGESGPPTVKVVDFGLVRPRPVALRFAGPVAGDDKPDEALHYTAPELLASGRAGPQSDLYSVGALLYRLLSGRPPFPFDRASEIVRGHLTHLPPSPYSIRPIGEMPPALPEILEQALDKAPARRFASAADMLDGIIAAIRGETLIDVTDEATVARVRVDDLMLGPGPGERRRGEELDDEEAPPEDSGSNAPLIIGAVVIAVTLGLLFAWQQLGRREVIGVQPEPSTTPVVAAVADAGPIKAPDAALPPSDAALPPIDAAPPPVDRAPPDAAAIVQSIQVTITSSPSDAAVILDDIELGRTPWVSQMIAGRYTFRLERAGYTPATVQVEVGTDGEPIEASAQLDPIRRRPRPQPRPDLPSTPEPPPADPDAAAPPPPPAPDAALPPPPPPPKPTPPRVQVLGESAPTPPPTPRPDGNREITPLGN